MSSNHIDNIAVNPVDLSHTGIWISDVALNILLNNH